jgi:mono/diheme cytochrome c family protein
VTVKSRRLVIAVLFGSTATLQPCWPKEMPKNSAVARETAAGAQLFKEQCKTCHSNGTTGGCLGPVLAGEGKRRDRAFIESRISDDSREVAKFERSYGHAELMPHPRVSPQMAKELSAYVSSLPAARIKVKGHTALASKSVPIDVSTYSGAQMSAQGQRLVYEKGCLACHTIHGMGGELAPKFDDIGSRLTPEAISQKITNAQLLIGPDNDEYNERGVVMPPLGLTNEQIKSITSYLVSLK